MVSSIDHTKAMVTAIRQGNSAEASTHFEQAMRVRLNSSLDEKKMAIAAQIYGKK